MTVLEQLNSGTIYLICGVIIAVIALFCIIFMIRAWRAGKALGLDVTRMKRAVTSSATFSLLPSFGILLGVLALSGSLGTPWPWLRLSVIGALHYETQVASAAAEQMGISLSGEQMTVQAFSSIALLMSICIMWGMILSALFNKKYTSRLQKAGGLSERTSGGFGDRAMAAMFIGMVSAYIGSYIGGYISRRSAANGDKITALFSFGGDWIPLVVVAVAATVMALLTWLSEKKKLAWLDNFSIAVSMLCGMLAAVAVGQIVK